MKIIIGSMNQTKVEAVKEVFPSDQVMSYSAESSVSAQPFSDEETRIGAINRAKDCVSMNQDAMGIGLEGGVMDINGQLFLCNWGALVDLKKNVHTASGARILLPKEISEPLRDGIELGDVMDCFAKKQGVRHKEGAIGIFTNDLVSRKNMFLHVVTLLRGQWEYWHESNLKGNDV
ncbi:inosine/xanthosine triphosphatase [Virgibacillus phasianinus]|uniref:inosine/xanthosine triphosphatase n=1 Tax=Virgibacillus phasianinus TaxID=2017483 RepID=A0A220U506_9BACI|nr:DUF84 family protein [Virgibacillus phasianinus]ASK62921.1 inosine/xanthosine triphosphatase [Virgibacillus phasianinus]